MAVSVKKASPIRHYRSLRAVREQRRLEISEVEAFVGFAKGRLADFESGKREPTRKQLDKLATTYNIPLYRLASDRIPNIPDTPPDFRKEHPSPASLSPRGMRAIYSSERISRFTNQLLSESEYIPADWTKATRQKTGATARAGALRQAFDTWYDRRQDALGLSGSAVHQFVTALRLFFEVQGGIVNVNDAPETDFMGYFIIPDDGVPSIFVNRYISSKKAQLFTLMHEYAHALDKKDGVSNPFIVRNDVERSCNNFAAEFIAPMDDFRKIVESKPKATRSDTFSVVNTVSAECMLSRHATAIRLLEGSYIERSDLRQWERVAARRPKEEKEEESADSQSTGGVPHAKRLSEIGHFTVYLASQAVKSKIIDSIDVQIKIGLSEALQPKAFDLAKRRVEAAL